MMIARTVRRGWWEGWRRRSQDGEREEGRDIEEQEMGGPLLRVAGDDWLDVRIYAEPSAKMYAGEVRQVWSSNDL